MSPIEHAYAEANAAFTLRFVGDGVSVDVTLGGAVLGCLFSRWLRLPDREGLLSLTLSAGLEGGTGETDAKAGEEFERATGGVRVRVVTADEELKVDVSGRLGAEQFDADALADPGSDGWPTNGVQRQAGRGAIREAHGDDHIAVGHGHGESPVESTASYTGLSKDGAEKAHANISRTGVSA